MQQSHLKLMFTKNINLLKIAAFITVAILLTKPASAQINGLTNRPLANIINDITVWLLGIAAAVAILFIVIGGLYYVTAGGDERQMESGKRTITYAIWGIFVIAVAYAIVVLVNKLVGG